MGQIEMLQFRNQLMLGDLRARAVIGVRDRYQGILEPRCHGMTMIPLASQTKGKAICQKLWTRRIRITLIS